MKNAVEGNKMEKLEQEQEEWGHPGGLIGAIMQQSLNNAHANGQWLHEYEKKRADKLEALLDTVRFNIQELYDGPYMPSPTSVIYALWPSEKDIEKFQRRDEF